MMPQGHASRAAVRNAQQLAIRGQLQIQRPPLRVCQQITSTASVSPVPVHTALKLEQLSMAAASYVYGTPYVLYWTGPHRKDILMGVQLAGSS